MSLEVKNLGLENSIFNHYIAEIRDSLVQKDRMRFRTNLNRMGQILGYEISKTLKYEEREVITPLGQAFVPVLKDFPVLTTVLRAGLPLHDGLLQVFDRSDNGFISAYRMHHKDNEFEIKVEYASCPSLYERTLILSDTMLATGNSMVLSFQTLIEEYGTPEHVHFVSVIGSSEGVEYLRKNVEIPATLWIGAIDEEMTAQSYIVPGLGDAGDLAFGQKD
tara:strand:+ start:29 stop:688 length:660 start_codon:yes stop_codon:yes gene_type:complete